MFGISLAKCDLRHVLRENEKVNVELAAVGIASETRATASKNFSCEVQEVAAFVWLGPRIYVTQVNRLPGFIYHHLLSTMALDIEIVAH